MKDQTILFVVNSLSGGGAERSATLICSRLRGLGFDVKIIALNRGKQEAKPSESFVELNRAWKSGPISTFRNFLQFSRELSRLNPDVVVANCELPELYCAFILRMRLKIIAVEHTSNPWAGRKMLGRITRTALRIRKVEWVTVNESQANIWFGWGKPKLIKNPVEKNFESSDSRIKEEVIYIGRIRGEKRPQWVIDAAIACSLSVAVIGEGDQLRVLKERYFPNRSLVKFYGFIENPWALLSTKSLIVMPSEYEGDGLVAVESIINGYPIVMARNQDLLRFQLPSNNYFSDQEELRSILMKFKKEGVEPFIPPESMQLKMQHERDISTVITKWVKMLSLS